MPNGGMIGFVSLMYEVGGYGWIEVGKGVKSRAIWCIALRFPLSTLKLLS